MSQKCHLVGPWWHLSLFCLSVSDQNATLVALPPLHNEEQDMVRYMDMSVYSMCNGDLGCTNLLTHRW